jgi:hypothetical protein
METVCFSETLVSTCKTTRRQNPGHHHHHHHHQHQHQHIVCLQTVMYVWEFRFSGRRLCKSLVFWLAAPFSRPVAACRRFTALMDAKSTSETSANSYQITRQDNTEDSHRNDALVLLGCWCQWQCLKHWRRVSARAEHNVSLVASKKGWSIGVWLEPFLPSVRGIRIRSKKKDGEIYIWNIFIGFFLTLRCSEKLRRWELTAKARCETESFWKISYKEATW